MVRKIEWDSYESRVLSGRNTKERFEKEYTKLIEPLISDIYDDSLNRTRIIYLDERQEPVDKPSLNQSFEINDSYFKKLMVNINDNTATPEVFAENLQKIHDTMLSRGYEVSTYTLYIEIDGRAYSVGNLPNKLINNDLLKTLKEANGKELFNKDTFTTDFE